jgi:acetoacetyl-CoA synthetase
MLNSKMNTASLGDVIANHVASSPTDILWSPTPEDVESANLTRFCRSLGLGVRIATAEIYAVVQAFPEIDDFLVLGASHEADKEIVLCVVPAEGTEITGDLAKRIGVAARERASPRHGPHRIYAVPAIPYTLNGKRAEGSARGVLAGGVVKNIVSLANPECRVVFAQLRREQAL